MNSSIKMELESRIACTLSFEYNKSKYHLKDVIVGKIYFLLVRIKIKHMEIAIIKRETTGTGPNVLMKRDHCKVRDHGWSSSPRRKVSNARSKL